MTQVISIRIAKFDQSVDVDWDALPLESKRYIIEYGLRQNLNDRVAGESEALAGMTLVVDRVTNLMSGEFRVGGGRESDPVKSEAKRLAVVAVRLAIRKAGKKLAEYEDQISGLVKRYLEKNPGTFDTAKTNVGARGTAEAVSLEDLV
jgi:hypothetical protein